MPTQTQFCSYRSPGLHLSYVQWYLLGVVLGTGLGVSLGYLLTIAGVL